MTDTNRYRIRLSKRLQRIGDLVSEGHVLLDVGCDHGYIPIYLLQNERIPYALASDIRPGPLSRAKEHVEQAGLRDRVHLECVGGIPGEFWRLLPGEYSDAPVTCVIAGMGGELMAGILRQGKKELSHIKEFVLSPQSDLGQFRRTLSELGLLIEEEVMLKEEGKFYTILRCVHSSDAVALAGAMSRSELEFGPILLKKKDPVLLEYLQWRHGILENIYHRLSEGGGSEERAYEIKEEMAMIEAVCENESSLR